MSSKEIPQRTKIGFLRVPVTEPRLHRSGVPFIDRCPSRAVLTTTTLPSRPELHCPFALAVSLRARPPFTLPRPMVRETLLWARHCLPTSATQHDARAQPRRSRSRQIKRKSSLLLVTQAAGIIGREKPPDTLPFLAEYPKTLPFFGRQTSSAYPARTLRSSCCVGIRPWPRYRGVRGRPESRLPSSMYLGHPLSLMTGSCKVGIPCRLPALAKSRVPAPPAKRRSVQTTQGAFHHLKGFGARAPDPSRPIPAEPRGA